MFSPSSTYRIQFHKDFRFKDFEKIIPYLKDLGVNTIYASPIFEAMPGSTHGYDVVNPLRINQEIGTEEELTAISKKLKSIGINWLQDIVPNHMAFHPSNIWLMDVLEKWDDSAYFNFFDLNFPTELKDKRLMVPFLGKPLSEAIDELHIQVISKDGKLYLANNEQFWPVNQHSIELIFPKGWNGNKAKKLEAINSDSSLVKQIVDAQYYRLCHWQETEKQINYRRFFTVNSLICLNIQHQEVFDQYHHYIFELVEKGIFQGLRIDHVDGLFDPKQYLERLQAKVGDDVYVVVEKILAANEEMPMDWPVAGSTGYDFLAIVNNLFTNRTAEKSFNKLYKEVIQKPLEVAEQVVIKKTSILFEHMAGELDHLYQLLISLDLVAKAELKKTTPDQLKQAIADLLVYCPVYRFYPSQIPLVEEDRTRLQRLISRIPKTEDSLPAINLLTSIFLDKHNRSKQQNALLFYQRCMQFSGPLMAKGVEDTLMYTYNRFIGNNEVGDAPDAFGLSVADFHEQMYSRLKSSPLAMNATATHDTKRGEDVRARLNVLTDRPEKWRELVFELRKNNEENANKSFELHRNDAYLIYQTILGAMPFVMEDEGEIKQRLELYIEKALREAKKRSDWASPNEDYEIAAKNFAISLLDQTHNNYRLLHQFLKEITDAAIINSLAQLLLKFTCPGVPDLYQGTELWDLSLVDPDNRRPVDFKIRKQWLKEIQTLEIAELWKQRHSGKIKLWLTQLLLNERKVEPMVFEKGNYIPVKVKGKYKKHVIAYLRSHEKQSYLVVVPLGIAKINKKGTFKDFDWKDTQLILPDNVGLQWENKLTKEILHKDPLHEGFQLNQLLGEFPVALLSSFRDKGERGSGILMHISSLASAYGIGDLGAKAYEFVDFLVETKQKYWQMLPLNPTVALQYYSPYAASSAIAGNTMLISPELLATQNLLAQKQLNSCQIPITKEIDFAITEPNKQRLLRIAYQNFIKLPKQEIHGLYQDFCKKQQSWLHDFVLFSALRTHHQNMPWVEWPEKYKLREKKALQSFAQNYAEELDELKWQQFIFYQQWHDLRSYANGRGIKLIGDLPFYVAYDSADVWANPNFFKLDKDLNIAGIAGVPPDGMSADGQLWGMPVFNWEMLKKDNYKWWMFRIRENLGFFDLLRLDHFRAFDSYWEVPGGEKTAVNGVWKEGPGARFFNAVCKEFDELPFIVEDLGSDMRGTEKLREKIGLPGMKVLQFAFGADLATSPHSAHNFGTTNMVVYTGTHDNNTTVGWYETEADELAKKRLVLYAGYEIDGKNAHQFLIRLALASLAKIAIIPLQDLFGYDESTRMNTPATTENNWKWRFQEKEIPAKIKSWLKLQTELFGRG